MQLVQNATACINQCSPILASFRWLPVCFKILLFAFKTFPGWPLVYVSYVHSRSLRYMDHFFSNHLLIMEWSPCPSFRMISSFKKKKLIWLLTHNDSGVFLPSIYYHFYCCCFMVSLIVCGVLVLCTALCQICMYKKCPINKTGLDCCCDTAMLQGAVKSSPAPSRCLQCTCI